MNGCLARKSWLAVLFIAACATTDVAKWTRLDEPDASVDVPCVAGTERCGCYGNGTCNLGLTCASRLCVHVSGEDGATGSGGKRSVPTGAGGANAKGGSIDGGPIADSSLPGNGSGGRGGASSGGQSSAGSPGGGGSPGGSQNGGSSNGGSSNGGSSSGGSSSGGSSSGGSSSGGSSSGGSSGAGGSNCPGYPTKDACSMCICSLCSTQVAACVASSDTAKNDVCKQIQACAEQKHCAGSPCYCTQSATDPLCLNPDGPCAGVIQAAVGSGASALQVQQFGNDSTHPLGRANAVETCELSNCRAECSLQ